MKDRFKTLINNRQLWTAFLLLLFLAVFTPRIPQTIIHLFQASYGAVSNFQYFRNNVETPDAGRQILPLPVQEMLQLLDKYQLGSYGLSPRMIGSQEPAMILIFQRIIESSWPKRFEPASKYKFIFIDELDKMPGCIEREREKEIILVSCH